jgi:sec-independent protein translocase protein TatA
MGELSVWHWLVVAAVVVVLFGSRKLPDAARSIGRSLRIFKSEMRELRDDEQPNAQARQTVIEGGTVTPGPGPATGPVADPATAGPASGTPEEQPK